MKVKDLKTMKKEELDKKMKELKTELVKSKVNASKTGSSKANEIRKIIARIHTLTNSKEEVSKK